MKFKTIRLENFRNFTNIEVSLENRNMFFGFNDVGKTNFLYAIRFLLDYSIRNNGFRLSDFHNSDDSKIIKILLEIDISDKDNEDTKKLVAKAGKVLSSKAKSLLIEAKSNKADEIYDIDLRWGYDVKNLEVIPQFGIKNDLDKLFDINYIGAQTDLVKLFALAMKEVLQRKADDYTALKDKLKDLNGVIDGLSSISNFGNLLSEEVSKYDPEIKVKLSSEDIALDPYKTLYPFLEKNNGALYYVSGDGLRKLTCYSLHKLIASRNSTKKISIFLVEEPENHLHKTTLLKLGMVLFKENEFPYLFLTTHSSDLLAEMDNINLVRIALADKTYSHFYSVPKEYQKVKKMLNSNLAQALFYNRVLLVEGPSEVMLFDAILKHKCKCNYKIKGIEILPVNGIAFVNYLKVLYPLNIGVYVKTDNDVTEEGTTLGLNRLKTLGEIITDLKKDDEKKKRISNFVINLADLSKPVLYTANSELIQLCNTENIYLSNMDLENDLANAMGEDLAKRLKKKTVADAIKYLQKSKLYNMITLVSELEDVDLDTIWDNSNFAVLEGFTNGLL